MIVKLTTAQAHHLSEQVMSEASPEELAKAFDFREVCRDHIAEMLINEPGETLRLIEGLSQRPPPPGEAKEPEQSPTPPTVQEPPGGSVLSDRAQLCEALRRHLKEVGRTTRKQICEALKIESVYIYNRLMQDMKKELRARGQRAKRSYSLR